MPAVPESFGDWLIDTELPERGIELAEFAREIGVRRSTIYRWRERNPRSSMVGRVARLLGYPYGELVERFGMGGKKARDEARAEEEAVRRTVQELAAYSPEVYESILRRVDEERRKQEGGNRKDS